MNYLTQKSLLFIGFTFFINWLMAILFFTFGGELITTAGVILGILYMFVPMIVVIIIQKFIYREPIKESLGISFKFNSWFIVAWLLPPAIAFATLGISVMFPGVEYSSKMAGMFERFKSVLSPEQLQKIKDQAESMPFHPIWLGLLQGLVAGITINAIAGFGEELGWRGFLQREFKAMGFWRSSMFIGLIWGIWHAPLILAGHNYPEHPIGGVFMMTIWCTLLGPLFSYVRLKANSVIAAAIMHGSLNGTAGLAIIVVKGGSDLTIGVTGLAGFIILIFLNIGLFIYDRFLVQKTTVMNNDAIR